MNRRIHFLLLCGLLAAALPGPAAPSRETLAQAVLQRYATFTVQEKQAALVGLAARKETAALVLEAIAEGKVPRADLPSYTARQMVNLKDPSLTKRLGEVWGQVGLGGATDAEAAAEMARWKRVLVPDFLKKADVSQGRALFKVICGQCHTLFNEGGKIGPDLTGSNRANLDYVLENVVNPNALIGKDYELSMLSTSDNRIISGLVRKETESALTVQTLTGEEVVARKDIAKQDKPGISMMPMGLFTALSNEQVRDLTGYLASPSQVPMPGTAGKGAKSISGAIEGETMKVLSKTGSAVPQPMGAFRDGEWSGGRQLWWTGAKPGDQLTLLLQVVQAGKYEIQAVLTRASDYGVVKFMLDGQPLGTKQIDLFGSKVTNTQVTLGERELAAGDHRLTVEITGANPEADKAYMFGLDYIWLRSL
ncbi:MAG: c-type cytochrome [Verrucomicrobiales bacterium]|nr:c-type cytochrome [Verrucomicrobiales bacterium]